MSAVRFFSLFFGVMLFCAIALFAGRAKNQRLQLMAALGTFYPMGEMLQYLASDYPLFVRSYLSDFGFLPFMTLMVSLIWGTATGRKSEGAYRLISVGVLAAALLNEVTQFIGGVGDWVDVAIFVGGWLLVQRVLALRVAIPATTAVAPPAESKSRRSPSVSPTSRKRRRKKK